MIPGLMQTEPLSTTAILRHAARNHAGREIVSRTVEGDIVRYGYGELERRCERLAKALLAQGVGPGDRVASLAWNTHRHLEMFFAVPGLGAVLHTVNPRLFEEQIRYILDHAGAKVLLFEPSFADLVDRLAPQLPQLSTFIRLTDEAYHKPGAVGALCYETLMALEAPGFSWPRSMRTPERCSATPPAQRAIPRACSIRTARSCCTPWPAASQAPSGFRRMT